MNRSRAALGGVILAAIFITGALLYAGCAEVARPPGGPEDRQGPVILASEPSNESVNVNRGRTIVIRFSEPILEPERESPVFISPRPDEPPEIDWKKDGIEITLADSFATNQTYIVSVSTDVKDWRGNRLDSAATVAFSTGPAIDSGSIGGRIAAAGQPQAGWTVGIWQIDSTVDSLRYDSVYPDYMTSTDRDGRFQFRYLPERRYRLVGWQDKNRDDFFSPYVEPFALPDRPIAIGGEYPLDSLRMRPTALDTTHLQIIAVSQTPDNLIRTRISRELNPGIYRLYPDWLTLTGETGPIAARSIQQWHLDEASTLTASFGVLPPGTYDLSITYDSTRPPMERDSIQIRAMTDEQPPSIVERTPESRPQFVDDIEISFVFSEPLNTETVTGETFLLFEDGEKLVAVTPEWLDGFHLKLTPEQLRAGHSYRLDVAEPDVADAAGNRLGDSIRTYQFSTLADDSLGAIVGQVRITLQDRRSELVQLEAVSVDGRSRYSMPVPNQSFSLAVPGGKYFLNVFIDRNENNRLDNGSLFPYVPAETYTEFPDTVSVRPRFETAGIDIVID